MLSKELKKEIKKYQNLYYKAKAEYETIRDINKENELKVLKENVFTDEDGNRVLEYDYMIVEDQYNSYLELLYIENTKAGLQLESKQIVPDYQAKRNLWDIEDKLFQLQLETLPNGLKADIEKAQKHHKYRDQALDLILKLSV